MYSGNHDWVDEFVVDFARDRALRPARFDEHDLADLRAFATAGPQRS